MKIITKLTIAFLSMALLVLIVGYFSANESEKMLQKAIEEKSVILAQETINRIDIFVYEEIQHLKFVCKSSSWLHGAMLSSNKEFSKLGNPQEYIEQKDREWRNIPEEEITPFMQDILNNKLSKLFNIQSNFHKDEYGRENIAEIFATNKYGANIGLTRKTTDYYQADEKWWQKAKEDGFYVSDVGYDESSGVYSIDICIRVNDKNGNFIGVIKDVFNIERVTDILKELKSEEKHMLCEDIMQIDLLTKGGKVIYSTGKFEFLEDISDRLPSFIFQHQGGKRHFDYFVAEGDMPGEGEKLYAYAHSKGYKDYKGLGWILMVEHEAKEVFAPVVKLSHILIIISLMAAMLAIILGVFIARSVSAPLVKLNEGVKKIGRGKLDTRIECSSNTPELRDLSMSFNNMAKHLKESTTSIDNLNKEINERKLAEEKLREKEEHLNLAIKGGNLGTWDWDITTDKVIFNELWAQMKGYSFEEIVPHLSTWEDLVHPDDLPEAYKKLHAHFKGKTDFYEAEFRMKHKSGKWIWILDRGRVIERDEDGNPLRTCGTHLDITERKQAEETLKESLEFEELVSSISSSFVGVFNWDASINNVLKNIGKFCYAERSYIFKINTVAANTMDNIYEWCSKGVSPQIDNLKDLPTDTFPWWMTKLKTNQSIYIEDVTKLPKEASAEKEILKSQNINSVIVLPLNIDGYLWGFIGFDNVNTNKGRGNKIMKVLQVASEILENAIQRKLAEKELQEAYTIINKSPSVAFTWKNLEEWPVEFVTENVEKLFGYTAEEFKSGKVLYARCVHPDDLERLAEEVSQFSSEKGRSEFVHKPYRIVTKMGMEKIIDDKTAIVRDGEGNITHYRGIITDITEKKKYQDKILTLNNQLKEFAYNDPLTKCFNRRAFLEILEKNINYYHRNSNSFALLFIDIDNFKMINDNYGHDTGDEVLKIASERINNILRTSDIVARFGGDEFVVLLHDDKSEQDAFTVAQKIKTSLNKTFIIDRKNFHINLCIGICLYPDDGTTADELLRNSDTAMYFAKQQGKNCCRMYDTEQAKNIKFLNALSEALENDEYRVYYQPILNCKGEAVFIEALIRWHSSEFGLVPPNKFIPVLEWNRRIIKVGKWIIKTTTNRIKELNKDKSLKNLCVTINLSPVQLEDEEFFKDFHNILENSKVDPTNVAVEITEAEDVFGLSSSISVLNKIRNDKIKILLDDFGAGYSSFNALLKFTFDIIKIDKFLIDKLSDKEGDRESELVIKLIAMLKNMNLKVLAEGVETEKQFKILKNEGCDYFQGYYFCKPTEKIYELLKNSNGRFICSR
ncbi:MAG: EAL domain-containing protein [Victivallales bacterium]|nr:EAL domain-containing protein [Victivallales bacterium]